MDPVVLWMVSSVVAPDAYARLVDTLTRRPQQSQLVREVRKETGLRPRSGYRRWLRQEQTWRDLVARQQDAYERLISSLASEEARGIIRERPVDRERATQLVNSTIRFFLPTLDPSLAAAVVDLRAERRHEEVLARLDASASFEQRIEGLPPAAREIVEDMRSHRGLAERLVDAVLHDHPRATVPGLVRSPPGWLERAPAVIHLVLAQIAQSYGLRIEAGHSFERVGDLGLQRSRWYARAAFEFAACEQSEHARELIRKAQSAGDDIYARVIAIALDDDWASILAALERDAAVADPFMAGLYAAALQQSGDQDGAIAFLSAAVEQAPRYTRNKISLAGLLLERSTKPGTTSRSHALNAALSLAVEARDERRQWRGDSQEAVQIACQAALLAGNYPHAIELGTPEPEGLAWAEEAADPEVQFSVAQAAIASGDLDTARRLANSATGFHQALIHADLLVASKADPADVDEHFRRAWSLVASDEEKVAFWLSASMAGIEPLPGADELSQRTDDLPVLVRASQHIARGRLTEAIGLLRANRQSEAARKLLTDAYLQNEQLDDGVDELLDMADRFNNLDHRVRAIRILAWADRLSEAAELADSTLPMLPPRQSDRDFLHEIGVAVANNRNDWPDMESRVRAWIDDLGPIQRRRWLLVNALFNQGDSDGAWRVVREAGGLEPHSPLEAQLWIVLESRYSTSSETLSKILALSQRFPDDPYVRAAAVNAFFLMGEDRGPIDPEELAYWHQLIAQRAEHPAPEDTFVSMSVPDDFEGLIETFRPLLEPRAQRIETWIGRVRKEGWPYGMLAAAAGRSYTSALVHRAAGFLPVASPHPEIADREREAASAALDRPVVVDISVLATAWFLKERWPQLQAAFSRIALTAESKRDPAIAAASMRPRSSSGLTWDVRTGRPVLYETSDEELDRLEAHVSWINDQAAHLSLVPTQPHSDSNGEELGAWITAFQAARGAGIALWADDVGLRTLARNEGVSTFGTDALIAVFESLGRLSPEDSVSLTWTLRDEYCVDFPIDRGWVLEAARRDGWQPRATSLTFARPFNWMSNPSLAFELWREITRHAGEADPMNVVPWVYAAATGIVGAFTRPKVVQLAAGIVVTAATAIQCDPKAFSQCTAAAATVLHEEGLPDPAKPALAMLFDMLAQQVGPTEAATRIARLGAELSDNHRAALREVLFDL